MDEKHKKLAWFIAGILGVAILLWWLEKRSTATVTETETPPESNDFYAPYEWPNGIYPDVQPFQSTVNVYVDNPAINTLAYQYIPTFGLVGMVGVQG